MNEYPTNKLSIDKTTDKDSIQLSSSSGSVKLNLFNDSFIFQLFQQDKGVSEMPLPYKVYSALISQSGLNNPTAIVLENTLGFVPTFIREEAGAYTINSNAGFPINKTFVITGPLFLSHGSGIPPMKAVIGGVTINYIRLNTLVGINDFYSDSSGDAGLLNTAIEIRVYD